MATKAAKRAAQKMTQWMLKPQDSGELGMAEIIDRETHLPPLFDAIREVLKEAGKESISTDLLLRIDDLRAEFKATEGE